MMGLTEKAFRIIILGERITALQGELKELHLHTKGARQDYIVSAMWHLQRAVQQLQHAQSIDRGEEMKTILEVSLQGIQSKKLEEMK